METIREIPAMRFVSFWSSQGPLGVLGLPILRHTQLQQNVMAVLLCRFWNRTREVATSLTPGEAGLKHAGGPWMGTSSFEHTRMSQGGRPGPSPTGSIGLVIPLLT